MSGRPLAIPVSGDLWVRNDHTELLGEIGGKGIGLSAMLSAGLPVPRGFIVPTGIYQAYLKKSGALKEYLSDMPLSRAERISVARAVSSLEFDDADSAQLIAEADRLVSPLAVRSSAVVEDSRVASWAGQFDSILGVRSRGVPRCVVRCWASVFNNPAAAYSQAAGVQLHRTPMAVIVQELVDAEWAGVAFSGKTLTMRDNPDSVLVEAVRGLGEQLVSGQRSPDLRAAISVSTEQIVRQVSTCNGYVDRRIRSPGELPDEALIMLVDGLRRIKEATKLPHLDIEWAWDGLTLWFLQARALIF